VADRRDSILTRSGRNQLSKAKTQLVVVAVAVVVVVVVVYQRDYDYDKDSENGSAVNSRIAASVSNVRPGRRK
jgi:uncharacterized membrane protein